MNKRLFVEKYLKSIISAMIVVFFIFIVLKGFENFQITVYGEEFNSNITPEKFYEMYGSDVVYNTVDDSIYWALKGSSKGYSSSTGYQRKVIRYTLSETPYYVDTCSDNSPYNECQELIVGDDYYNMAKVKLATLLELFAEKYDSVDFSKYFSGKYTIEMDALMSIRVNNIYQCYEDITDGASIRGVIVSNKAKAAGKSAYTGLYTTATSMRNAYLPYANVNFESWYDRLIDITPSDPTAGVDYDIRVGELVLTGGNNYKYSDDTYYVKALKDFTLSFDSRTYQNGKIKANATYQPSINGIISVQKLSDNYRNVPVYKYFTSPFGADKDTFSTTNTYSTVYNTVYVTQKRSSNLTTLSTAVTMNMDELDYVPTFASMSRLVVAGKNVKSVESPYINIIPDGTGPVINGVTAVSGWIKADNYQFKVNVSDNLSGVKNIKIYVDGVLKAQCADADMIYKVNGAGNHSVSVYSEDNVGNISEEQVSVKLDSVIPEIKGEDNYEIEEEETNNDIIIINLPVADRHSGVGKIEVYDDGRRLVAYKVYDVPVKDTIFNITIDGENCIGDFKDYTVKVWDAVGNVSEKSIKIKYNKKVFVKPIIVGTH